MKRRDFIKDTAIGTTAASVIPPANRLAKGFGCECKKIVVQEA